MVVLQQNRSPALCTLGVCLLVEAPREAGGDRRKDFRDLPFVIWEGLVTARVR